MKKEERDYSRRKQCGKLFSGFIYNICKVVTVYGGELQRSQKLSLMQL